MLKKYKSQLDQEKSSRTANEEQNSLDNGNTGTQSQSNSKYDTQQQNSSQSTKEIDRKHDLLQRALGLSSTEGKENISSIKNTKQTQKKKYLNQNSHQGTGKGITTTTTVCHVNLVNDNIPFEHAQELLQKNSKDNSSSKRVDTEHIVSSKNLLDEVSNHHDLVDMRGNMSITKSIVDYYHHYKSGSGVDDLMSLYKTNKEYIYVICKSIIQSS